MAVIMVYKFELFWRILQKDKTMEISYDHLHSGKYPDGSTDNRKRAIRNKANDIFSFRSSVHVACQNVSMLTWWSVTSINLGSISSVWDYNHQAQWTCAQCN